MTGFEYAGDREYRRMVTLSVAFHVVALGITLIATSRSSLRKFEEPSAPGALHVMWAKTVRMPPKTPDYKLPGPQVEPEPVAPPKTEKPKIVMPKDLPKTKAPEAKVLEPTPSAEEAERQKMMAEAVASMRRNAEKRPVPRADNFPSAGGTAETGAPAGPSVGIGALSGDPIFGGYKAQVRDVLTQNFVWIRKKGPEAGKMRAEVSFHIDEAGNVLEPKITKSSGDIAFDGAALRAVKRASPLPPPPASIARDVIREGFVIVFSPEML